MDDEGGRAAQSPQQQPATNPHPPQPYIQQHPQYPWYQQYPYYPGYPPMPFEPRKDDTSIGIAIVALVVVFLMAAVPFMLILSSLSSWDNAEWSDVAFDDEVILATGGNFRVLANWGATSSVHIFMNVTEGSAVDIYIMTDDQFESTYPVATPSAFSSLYEWEGVTELDEDYEVDDPSQSFYVIVDNVDNPLRPGDAVPSGCVELELKVVTNHIEYD